MWRDPVAPPVDSVLELESRPVAPNKKRGNGSLLWREQVKVTRNHRVFILEPAPQLAAISSDTRLWREQI